MKRIINSRPAHLAAAFLVGSAVVALPTMPALAASLPDLQVAIAVSPAQAVYAIGDQVTFIFTVTNAGDATALGARLDGGTEEGITRASDPPGERFDLAPGEQHTITWDGTIDRWAAVGGTAHGNWTFDNDAGEANQADNMGRFSLPVPGLTGDLTVKTFADILGTGDSRQHGTSGVGLTLTDDLGATVATAITDATGNAKFTGIPAGDRYRIAVADWQLTDDAGHFMVKGGDTLLAALGLVPGSGPAAARPTVSSTGLIEGQQLGLYPRIRPAYADDAAVTKVEVLVDGVSVKSFPAPIPAELSFALPDPARLHDTDAQVTVRAYDADGNTGERSTRVHVDALAPEFAITPAFGATLNGVVTFQAAGLSPDVARIQLRDSAGTIVAQADQAPWTLTWDTRGRNGDEFVQVQAFDTADNGSYLGGTYRIDNAGPTVTAITPSTNTLIRGSVRTTVTASDPSGVASASVRGGKATTAPFTWTVTPTTQGPFTIEWTVTDRLGNRTVARRVVVNDTVRPTLKVTKAPKNRSKLTKTATITASAADRNGIARVQMLVNGKLVATDYRAGYAFTLNPKKYGKTFTVQLRTYDRAGNVTASSKLTYRR